MTFCVGIKVRDGVVALADTRIVRGSEQSNKAKLAAFQHDQQSLLTMTSGLRSVRDKTLTYVDERLREVETPTRRLYQFVNLFGEQLRRVRAEDGPSLAASNHSFNMHAIICGRLAEDESPDLFFVYPEGNWVEASEDCPYYMIGRTSYGKPILDRLLRYDTPLQSAVALALLAFDATRSSVTDVDFPVDVAVISKRCDEPTFQRFDQHDLGRATDWWSQRLSSSLNDMPMGWADGLLRNSRRAETPPASSPNQFSNPVSTTNNTNRPMSQIEVGSDLTYEVQTSTVFQFQISCLTTDHQRVLSEQITFNPQLNVECCKVGMEGNRIHRAVVEPCTLQVSYRATVELTPEIDRSTEVAEWVTSQMPAEVLPYMNPSRYCESDLLARFAFEEFGQFQRGFARVQRICDWVYEHLDYTPGSTTATSTAADVLLQRTGVCRDYAHLAIALCRGVGIPSRYVAGYAVDLQPPDFHGFMEAYLGGHWYLFDPTRLAPLRGLVRIGVGRDAADVAFATLSGTARSTLKNVWANPVATSGSVTDDSQSAVSTA